jgi:hypothetical protein
MGIAKGESPFAGARGVLALPLLLAAAGGKEENEKALPTIRFIWTSCYHFCYHDQRE